MTKFASFAWTLISASAAFFTTLIFLAAQNPYSQYAAIKVRLTFILIQIIMKPTVMVFRLGLLISILSLGAAKARTSEPLVLGMDHIPVVVADLEKAEADFRALGFTIKPGRLRPDGIRNAHVKFSDGTAIELITAPLSVDALTAEYRAKLENHNSWTRTDRKKSSGTNA